MRALPTMVALALTTSCGSRPKPHAPVKLPAGGISAWLAGLAPATPVAVDETHERLEQATEFFLQRTATTRLHLQLDKPLYRPGEAIWVRAWELETRSLETPTTYHSVTIELFDPKGTKVADEKIVADSLLTDWGFKLPESAPGGQYSVRATSELARALERHSIGAPENPEKNQVETGPVRSEKRHATSANQPLSTSQSASWATSGDAR